MWFRTPFDNWLTRSSSSLSGKKPRTPKERRRSRSWRPLLEVLEERALLSTYTVNSLEDTGTGSGDSGDLRYCITNATSGADTITFAQGLTGSINLQSALPILNASVAIEGPGALVVTVQEDCYGFTVGYPVFAVGSAATVNVSGLSIDGFFGDAITNAGTLTVSACNLGQNAEIANSGALTLNACLIANGGIANQGTATVNNCNFNGGPGGATISNSFAGILTLNYCTLSGNTNTVTVGADADGGAIFNQGALTLNFSTLTNNVAKGGSGKVVGSSGSTTITSPGNGLGGGIYVGGGTLSINSSTLSDNQAVGGNTSAAGGSATGYGGGLFIAGGTVSIDDSTFAYNQAIGAGNLQGVGSGFGGGLYLAGGGASISNSTVARNQAMGGGAANLGVGPGYGGGIATNVADLGLAMQIHNTIVADNSASTAAADLDGNFASLGFNLIGNSDGGAGFVASDLVNVDPLLGPLQNNGGPTQTMALLPGSPALQAGDASGAPNYDQRGPSFPRIVNGFIDIGAFEVQDSNVAAPTVSSISPSEGPTSGGTAVTITGDNLSTAATAWVEFGSNPGIILSDNGSQIVALSPEGTGTVDVTVATAGGISAASSADQFSYLSLTLAPSTVAAGSADLPYSVTFTATGGSGSYTFAPDAGSILPAGLSLSSSGTLSGTPFAGSFFFDLLATDTVYPGVMGSQSYTLTVNPAATLTLGPTTLPTATADQPFNATLTADGGSGNYAFTLAPGSSLPAGLDLSSTGAFTGAIPSAGTFTFTVMASDNQFPGLTGSEQFTLTVDPANTLTLTPSTLPEAVVGRSYGPVTIAASGGSGSYTFALAAGSSLPAGLTLSSSGVLSGTATTTSGSPFSCTITAVDNSISGLTGSQNLTLTVVLTITYTVTSLGDSGTGSDDSGDLLYCITQADLPANAGSTIMFDAGLTGGTIELAQGQLVVTDAMTIIGPGAGGLTIDGNDASRLFDVASGGSLTLENLTLSGGLAQGTGAAAEGGAIFSSGTLALSGITLQNNEAVGSNGASAQDGGAGGSGANAYGGGIYVAAGSVTLTNDTLNGNKAVGGDGGNAGFTSGGLVAGAGGSGGAGCGGGLYVAAGAVTLTYDTLSNNNAAGGQAGFGVGYGGSTRGGGSAPDVSGANGGAGCGGGLYVAAGAITLTNDTLNSNNAVGGMGGGTGGHNGDNPAPGGSGGAGSGGGLYLAASSITLTNDTLTGNQAVGGIGGTGAFGGGSGNFYPGGTGGAGGAAAGGGLYLAAGSLTLSNSTLSGNQAAGGAGGAAGFGGPPAGSNGPAGTAFGGGIDNDAETGALQMYDTILADDSASTADPDLNGGVTSLGFNLIGSSTGGSGYAASDLLNVDPNLGPLQNNGGPTETMALLPGSPAINAGDIVNVPAYDQRGPGFPRTQNGFIDIGAFEVQSPSTTPGVTQISPDFGPTAGGTTVTIAGVNLGTAATATVDFGNDNPATIVSDNGTQLVVVDPAGSGTVDVTVTTADGTSASVPADQFTYVNSLTLSYSTLPAGTADQSYSVTITAIGGSGSYVFALASGSSLPSGLTLSSSGTIAGTASTPGSYTFTLVASDTVFAGVSGTQQCTLTVNPTATLTLNPTSLPTATLGDSFGPVDITATGGSGSYSFALATGSALPAGLTMTSAGVLSGTPTATGGSPFRFTIVATDQSYAGATASQTFTLTVDPAITLSPTNLPAATVADPVNDQLTAQGGSGSGYTFTLASGSSLPSGMTLGSAGTLTGTPTQLGTYAFSIVVTDSIGATATANVTLTVSANTETADQRYIAAVYTALLDRPADAAGLAYWSGLLEQGTARSTIAAALTSSAEYYATDVIKPAYSKFLNRSADPAGLAYWTAQLQVGMTDEQMQAAFIASPEFYDSANGGGSVAVTAARDRVWVDALYQSLLGRSPDQTGEDFWTAQLQGSETRDQVANGFTGSTEGLSLLIQQTYERYLGRPADPGGLAYWLSQYQQGAIDEDIVTGLISSDEFFNKAQ